MIAGPLVLGVSFGYLLLLFAIAAFGDRRAARGRSVIDNAWIYALSLAVYCTAWTYFGSVGRAAASGVWFLPIYLGPMLAMLLAGTRGAQDDPHRADLPDHLDRRLHRQPLRQEPAAGRAGHADHRRRHRPLHRAAAEGGVRGLSRAHRRPGVARGAGGRLVAGRHAPGRAGAGGVHHRVRHAAPRQHRAARGHGRGHRLRVGGQAGRLPRGGRLRDLGPVRRHGRHLVAGAGVPGAACAAAPRRRGRRRFVRLRAVVRADAAVDALGAAAAAAVPDDGGRMRRRAAPAAGRLGLPRLPAAHQRLRAADRDRRAGAVRPGAIGRRDLRAVAAAGARRAGAGALRLCGRPLRGHRHADRRDDRRLDHGLQRPGHAVAPAPARVRRARGRRPDAAAAQHPAGRDPGGAAARLPLLPRRRRGLCAGQHRPDQLRGRRAVRAGAAGRHVLARRHASGGAGRAARRLRRLGLHADAALGGQVGLDPGRIRRARPVRHRVAGARAAVRPRRARQSHPFAVLEPPGQRRALRRPVAAARAFGPRGEPGAALRRRVRAGAVGCEWRRRSSGADAPGSRT